MVKGLDDIDLDQYLDHVGIDLWRANRLWMTLFQRAMVAAGHGWFRQAPANLLAHLERSGTPQGLLPQRLGMSKQAVQQVVDDLERHGIVRRDVDPADRRARIIRFTPRGDQALADAWVIKRDLERQFAEALGADFPAFRRALGKLLDSRLTRDSDQSD